MGTWGSLQSRADPEQAACHGFFTFDPVSGFLPLFLQNQAEYP